MATDKMHAMAWDVPGGDVRHVRPGEVHVWRVRLDTASAFEACWSLLSADERERAVRFRTNALRTAFVISHAALRRILASYTGVSATGLEFDVERHGRPVLRWPSGDGRTPLHFSLSHSGVLAVIGVSTEPIGVDVERIRPMPDAARLAGRFFSADENRAFHAVPAANQADAFFRCWTRKEAFVKALGDGLSHPLADFTVSLHPDAPAVLNVAGQPGEAGEWALRGCDPGDGYAGAIAIRRRRVCVSFFDVPL